MSEGAIHGKTRQRRKRRFSLHHPSKTSRLHMEFYTAWSRRSNQADSDYQSRGSTGARRGAHRPTGIPADQARKARFRHLRAPFGTGFFFSWWLAELPTLTRSCGDPDFLRRIYDLWNMCDRARLHGLFWESQLVWACFGCSAISSEKAIWHRRGRCCLGHPVLRGLYEKLFQPSTYYRADTTAMFSPWCTRRCSK